MDKIYSNLENLFATADYSLLQKTCKLLIENYPNDIKILTYYSRALLILSYFNEAEQICLKILKLDYNSAEAHLNLARVFSKNNQIEKAIDHYNICLKINPTSFVYFELGLLLFNKADYKNSGFNITKAVKLEPTLAEGYFYLGLIYQKAEKIYLAIESFKEAIHHKHDYSAAYNNLGALYLDLNKLDEAIYHFNQSIKFNNKFYLAYSNLAQAYLIKGDFDKTKSTLAQCFVIKPDDGEPHRLLSTIYKYSEKNDHFKQMLKFIEDKNLNENSRMHFYFALAKANEDLKDYKSSAEFLIQGNTIRRKDFNYNIKNDIYQFELIKKNFSKDFFTKHSNSGFQPAKPIFIVGMPRSGTTLVEQIISSHHDVYGAGELSFLANVINEIIPYADPNIFFNNLKSCDSSLFTKIGESYFNLVSKLNDEKKFIIDKMPVNFRLIGFIKLALPNAKIIHCTRSAHDTCLSIYKNYFGKNVMPWAYDQLELSQYYNQYKQLMEHWRELIPDFIYDISYENLVSDQINETKKLIKFCNLTWDENCINFHENKRAVGTASLNQVRQKIYKGSVELWRNYEKTLPQLFNNLV